MQKRAANAIRGLVESDLNPIKSIHDHGAGGHLNCLSELVEETGGIIDVEKLPIGDPTLSRKELIGNESQERMGLVIDPKDTPILEEIAARERAPLYKVGPIGTSERRRPLAAISWASAVFSAGYMMSTPPAMTAMVPPSSAARWAAVSTPRAKTRHNHKARIHKVAGQLARRAKAKRRSVPRPDQRHHGPRQQVCFPQGPEQRWRPVDRTQAFGIGGIRLCH